MKRKQQNGYFKKQNSKVVHEMTWTGLEKRNIKREFETPLIFAQNDAMKTNYMKAKIDHMK